MGLVVQCNSAESVSQCNDPLASVVCQRNMPFAGQDITHCNVSPEDATLRQCKGEEEPSARGMGRHVSHSNKLRTQLVIREEQRHHCFQPRDACRKFLLMRWAPTVLLPLLSPIKSSLKKKPTSVGPVGQQAQTW